MKLNRFKGTKVAILITSLFLWAWVPGTSNASLSTQDLNCLTNNVYHEARGEPTRGQQAVVSVTLNRLKSKRFPNTVCKVVHQPYQFSWTLKPNKIKELETYKNVKKLVVKTVKMHYNGKDFSNGAMYFKRSKDKKWHNSVASLQVGKHTFYKPLDESKYK